MQTIQTEQAESIRRADISEHFGRELDVASFLEEAFPEWDVATWQAKDKGYHWAAHNGVKTSISSKVTSHTMLSARISAYRAIQSFASRKAVA
jgi:hypothetical protein